MGLSRVYDNRIDMLKCIAIARVVTVHTSAHGLTFPIASMNWTAGLFWGSLARGSVPIFLMCSGLLLDPAYDFNPRRFYSKNYVRILVALLFWATVYKIYRLALAGGITSDGLVAALKDVLLFRHEGHLYYLQIVLLIYALLPILRLFVQHADKRLYIYALCLWYGLGIVYPTLKPFWPFSLLSGIPAQWMLNMTYAAIGYCLLGYYLRRYGPEKRSIYWLLIAAGFLMVFITTYAMSVRTGSLFSNFFEGMSVPVSLLSIGIYGVCINAMPIRSEKWKDRFRFGSKASFCIYLLHILIMDEMFILLENVDFNYFLLIPAAVIVNIAICCLIYVILDKIPLCRKYLI